MVITIEPGLYVAADRANAPEDLRGIGIRIEDIVFLEEACPRLLTRSPREGVVIGQGASA